MMRVVADFTGLLRCVVVGLTVLSRIVALAASTETGARTRFFVAFDAFYQLAAPLRSRPS